MLTYLVVSQLTARHGTGEWLKVEDLVECAQIWLRFNDGEVNSLKRMALCRRAQDLATHAEQFSETTFDTKAVAGMFFDGLRLDFRSPAVVEIYTICLAHLLAG
ncbi:hypothetical protein AYM40_15200 [Paraburkholderia phytofirmans OLGA172]|uniref:Uncharacterized protein n=2 Tax=Paraburkholderia phytofirmans TaxID=261302 RepID=A0A160FLU6_9BURK|nr:hypothetical protein AYM40_15200 [Paraburkholderia phytofirmans OLGA172]